MAKVLIAEDSFRMRDYLAELLGANGYETVLADNGELAVIAYRQTRPDVVLMDITMPRKDGLQALIEIRAHDSGAKVIMLAHLDQRLTATRAIHIGAKDFLIKPFPPGQVLAAVRSALRPGR
jgi:two-component system chemotaxis response regulator CheY